MATTHAMTKPAAAEEAASISFERFAGVCALLAAASGFLYSLSFVIIKDVTLYSVFLMLGGLLAVPVMVALFTRLREVDASFALLGVFLAVAGSLGSLIHGGYDLANALHPPKSDPLDAANLPNLVDPRSLLTFGIAGIGLFFVSWLITRSPGFPKALGYLGYLLSALLVILYLGRLIILDASSYAILIPAALAGFIASPLFYGLLGASLLRKREAQ